LKLLPIDTLNSARHTLCLSPNNSQRSIAKIPTAFLNGRGWPQIFSAILLTAIFLLPASLSAQSFYGSITGLVTDSGNLPVPNATVTLVHVETGIQKTSPTSESGLYEFLNLVPGTYTVEVAQTGFAREKKGPIPVQVQGAVRIDFSLKVGSVSETVEVTSEVPLLQTEEATVSQVVEQRTVEQMPLNGRNVMNLVALVPGVVPQGSSGVNLTNQNLFSAGNFQVDGGAANQSATYLDGAPVNTNYGNLTSLVPSQDSIAEFRVVTNNDSAEYGRYTGGVVNFTTKSGTKEFHGGVYEFLRNKVLNANSFFNDQAGIPKSAFTQNQFGANVGGPIIKDRFFIFGSYEGFRLRQGVTYVETVPTQAEQAGDFSALTDSSGNPITIYNPFTTCGEYGNPACAPGQTVLRTPFPNNNISGFLSPASQALAPIMFPLPNNGGPGATVNNFAADAATGGGNDQVTIRGDYTVSNTQTLFARWTRWHLTNLAQDPYQNGTCFDSGQCPEGFTTNQAVIGDTISLGHNLLLDLRGSYLLFNYARNSPTLGYDLTNLGWPSFMNNVPFRALPGLSVAGYDTGGSISIIATNNIYSFTPSVTWIVKKHTFKFGGEGRRLDFTSLQDSSPSGTYNFDSLATSSNPLITTDSGNSFASFLLGTGSSGSLEVASLTRNRMWYQGYYAADTYRATSKLTVDLGIRWEFPGAWTENKNSIANFDPGLVTSVGGVPAVGGLALVNTPQSPGPYLTKNNKKLFAPRLGLSYAVLPNTVIRAGYGIFFIPADVYYFESPFNNPVNNAANSWNASTNGELSFNALFTNPFPNGLTFPPGRTAGFQPFGTQLVAPEYNEPYGYTQQWNFAIQHQFAGNFSLDAAYVGSKGTSLPMQEGNLNAIPDQDLSQGAALLAPVTNPYYGAITSGPLSGPTIPAGQLLRPYPQYTNVLDMGYYHGDSIYHSLQLKAQKQLQGGGTVLASYTWAKSISDTDTGTWWLESGFTAFPSDYNNLGGERSLSAFDTTQRLVLSYVYDLPFGHGKKVFNGLQGAPDKIVSGWGVNGVTLFQSGFPLHFNIVSSPLSELGGGAEQFGIPVLRPDVIQGCDKNVSGGALSRLGEWFNTSCFAQPASFAYGSEPRVDPSLRSQGIKNFDFALFKKTPITERVGTEFRVEFFNIFNRVQFAPPGNYFGVPTFGVISSQLNNPRLVQFALRFSF
jgi:hypothetical protein